MALPTDEEFAARIQRECFNDDTEMDHIKADEIIVELLVALGFQNTAAAYDDVAKWYA